MPSMSINPLDEMETALNLYLSGVKCFQRCIGGFSKPRVFALDKLVVETRRADSNRSTRHEFRGLRGQKRHRPRDLLRGGDAPEGALQANTLSLGPAIGHAGHDEASPTRAALS